MSESGASFSVEVFNLASSESRAALAATAYLPGGEGRIGVVFVSGGQQIRSGSHRQFLALARRFAAEGYACLRFDLPGLGDSEGQIQFFDDNAPAVRAAVDALLQRAPLIEQVVLWGLCDGATAAALYACGDARVGGLILVNPWVRTEQGQARVLVSTYYLNRLASPAFWRKLLRGQVAIIRSVAEWLRNWHTAHRDQGATVQNIATRVKQALESFAGPVQIVIAEQDLTGQEFLLLAQGLEGKALLKVDSVEGADHTFSMRRWHAQLESLSLTALAGLRDTA